MKETGVVRRIDELGRIVVPKEIRRRLKISTGDQIDISISGNSIILYKYEPLNDIKEEIKVLIEGIIKYSPMSICVFDDSKCIYSNYDNINLNDEIDNELLYKIKSFEQIEITDLPNIKVTNEIISMKNIYAKRIIANYDYLGCVIIIKDNSPTKIEKEMVNIVAEYISRLNEYKI